MIFIMMMRVLLLVSVTPQVLLHVINLLTHLITLPMLIVVLLQVTLIQQAKLVKTQVKVAVTSPLMKKDDCKKSTPIPKCKKSTPIPKCKKSTPIPKCKKSIPIPKCNKSNTISKCKNTTQISNFVNLPTALLRV